jgi:hypothetical protein
MIWRESFLTVMHGVDLEIEKTIIRGLSVVVAISGGSAIAEDFSLFGRETGGALRVPGVFRPCDPGQFPGLDI